MMSIGRPDEESPMRREKNRSIDCGWPNWNVDAFSRKNGRFSGKNRSKRVRLTCSSSASTCAKSVFTVDVEREVGPDAPLEIDAAVPRAI